MHEGVPCQKIERLMAATVKTSDPKVSTFIVGDPDHNFNET